MAQAMATVREVGKHPEEAAATLFRAHGRGTLIGQADHVLVEYPNEGTEEYRDHVVPAGVLDLCPMPPLGHAFWRTGDIQIRPAPLPDGSVVDIARQNIEAPLGALLTVYTIRGFRVPRG
jgi:hypothetical protein